MTHTSQTHSKPYDPFLKEGIQRRSTFFFCIKSQRSFSLVFHINQHSLRSPSSTRTTTTKQQQDNTKILFLISQMTDTSNYSQEQSKFTPTQAKALTHLKTLSAGANQKHATAPASPTQKPKKSEAQGLSMCLHPLPPFVLVECFSEYQTFPVTPPLYFYPFHLFFS
jgi:hypothetical protein